MFYEEQIINGVLCFRNTPNGEWNEFTIQQLSEKCFELKRANLFYSSNIYEITKQFYKLRQDMSRIDTLTQRIIYKSDGIYPMGIDDIREIACAWIVQPTLNGGK
jgi:hypothetical protein